MGHQAKLRKERKQFKLSRPPIPPIQDLKSKLNSIELRDWLIDQWSNLLDFAMFVTPTDASIMASTLLERLSNEFDDDLDKDSSLNYNLSDSIRISVGINAYHWTVWAVIKDRSTGVKYITPDDCEFKLVEKNKTHSTNH